MPRMKKIPIQAMEDIRPEPRPMYPPSMSGGAICHICKGEIDKCCEMEGEGVGKVIEKVKKAGKKTGKYITDTGGLSSDLLNYGLPATTAALLSAPATAFGGPAAGIAASALGSKLGVMASDKIAKETVLEDRTGEGLKPKRQGRFPKGSDAAKEHMRMLREKRQKK